MMLAGVVALFIGVILIICYPINKKKNARCSMQAQGVLRGIVERHDSDGSLKDAHVYSYNVNGVEYQLQTTDHNLEVHQAGDTCTIWYNPANPQDAQAFRGSDKYLKILLIIGIVMTLLGFLFICVGFVQQFIL